jgi:hypothetical protein
MTIRATAFATDAREYLGPVVRGLLGALWMVGSVGCGGGAGEMPEPPGQAGGDSMTDWERRRYTEKVAQALRGGRGIGPGDDLPALLTRDPDQLVELFMSDPGFVDTALDFNLFFLGLEPGSFRDERNQLGPAAVASRRATHSALELARGGDYLSLLAPQQPLYTYLEPPARRSPPPLEGASPEGEWALTDLEVRQLRLQEALAGGEKLIAMIERGAAPVEVCGELNESAFPMFLFEVGLDETLAGSVLRDPGWLGDLIVPCMAEPYRPVLDRVARIRTLGDRYRTLTAFIDERTRNGYRDLASLDGLITLDVNGLELEEQRSSFDFSSFYSIAENSSTNYNRRRAAYVLDRFFCDDLKPIRAALPAAHVGDQHASDPACMACHYKLDPMAGFFKDRGAIGWDFGAQDQLLFDDLAAVRRTDYVKAWAAPPGSGRAWDIGYIRSPTNLALNSYGEDLEDLGRILQTAPEVKACLVRRAFEFFNGSDQLVDPGYLAALTGQFMAEAGADSSRAFKSLVRRVLTGRTFRQVDPRSDECYDVAPDARASRPPCAVAFIVQENCASCHTGTTAQGGLDLLGWTRDSQGNETFPHRTTDGIQLPAAETMKRLLDRITTSDPARQMPLGRSMPAQQREALYLWADGRQQGGREP